MAEQCAETPTSSNGLRPGALPVDHDENVRVTVRVPTETLRKIDHLVEEGVYRDQSSALRAGAYEIVEVADKEVSELE